MLNNKIKRDNGNWKKNVREELGEINPYIPGKPMKEVKREYGLDRVIKLASNENPLGVSKKVKQIIKEESSAINRYPDGDTGTLKKALAGKLNITTDMITFGNGSDGLLKVLAETFLKRGNRTIISYPSFVEYKFVSKLMGCQLIRVWKSNYHQNLDRLAEAVTENTSMIFLTNPDNPTGTTFSQEELEFLLSRLPDDIILVLDEAYHEYVQKQDYPDGIDYVKEGYPIIVLRTFSKAYGLAGLRLGYAVSSPQIKELLMKARDPFNVNHLAEKAGKAALADEKHLQKTIEINEKGKSYLYKELNRLGLDYVETEANFMLIRTGVDSVRLFDELLKQGIIIRPGKPLGYPGHIRVTIGLPEENREFIEALELTLREKFDIL